MMRPEKVLGPRQVEKKSKLIDLEEFSSMFPANTRSDQSVFLKGQKSMRSSSIESKSHLFLLFSLSNDFCFSLRIDVLGV